MEEIKKYTTLEIKYSQHNKFKVSKEAQERACRETLDNMLIRYKSKR